MPEQKLPSLIGKSNINTAEDYMNKGEMYCFSYSATLQVIKCPFSNISIEKSVLTNTLSQ